MTEDEISHALDLLAVHSEDPRAQVLLKAAVCTLQDRNGSFGEPEDNFATIADLWLAYLGGAIRISTVDVAIMFGLQKIARLAVNPEHMDGWVDLAGYAACGARCVEPHPRKEGG